MGTLEELIAKVDTLITADTALREEVALLRGKVAPDRETYTLKDIASLPGSPSIKTLRNCPDRQPRHGEPDGWQGREKAWKRETVEEWRRKLDRTPKRRGEA